MVFKYFFGGWVGGWGLEKWGLKLISTQVVVEVGVELGNKIPTNYGKEILCLCGTKKTMMHIYITVKFGMKKKKRKISYNNIYN